MCISSGTQATTRCPSGLVIACVLDDIHIYDMFFCYLLTGALAGLVVACVPDEIHIYDMFFVIY
jgi:hypothetical protein